MSGTSADRETLSPNESSSFEWLAAALEARTMLDRMAARGTVRLAFARGGVDTRLAPRSETLRVLEHILPKELSRRGIRDSETLCLEMHRELMSAELPSDPTRETPEEVFNRIFGPIRRRERD